MRARVGHRVGPRRGSSSRGRHSHLNQRTRVLGMESCMSIARCFALIVFAVAVPVAAHADCLWAGSSFPDGDNVFANGLRFVCHSDSGSTYWLESGPSHFDADVPGEFTSTSNAGQFSVGAMLLDDNDHLQQVSDYGGGNVWNDAGSLSDWDGSSGGGGGGIGIIEG